jgi:hypothetical protein
MNGIEIVLLNQMSNINIIEQLV